MLFGLFDTNALKILTIMSVSRGSRFQRKELKQRTRMNNAVLDVSLQMLANSGIILREKRLFFLNLESGEAKQAADMALKEYRRLREIPFDAYFSTMDVVYFLGRLKNIEAYMFGSYAKLVFKEESDIDIAIISDIVRENRDVSRIAQKAGKRYGKRVELHYFGRDFCKNKSDPLVKDILTNGIKLI